VGVVGDELIQRIGTWFPIRVASRYLAVSGYDRALVSWLIVLGLLLVVGAVVSAEMAHDPPRLRRSAPVSPEPSDGG
jgi:hypothetical protein